MDFMDTFSKVGTSYTAIHTSLSLNKDLSARFTDIGIA